MEFDTKPGIYFNKFKFNNWPNLTGGRKLLLIYVEPLEKKKSIRSLWKQIVAFSKELSCCIIICASKSGL